MLSRVSEANIYCVLLSEKLLRSQLFQSLYIFGFNSNFAQISIWEIPSQQSLKQTEKDTIIAISKT